MDLSLLLARMLGLYLVVFSIPMILNEHRIKSIVSEVNSSPALLLLSGILPLILGTLLVSCFQVWSADWRIIITLIGWLALIKGVIRIIAPKIAIYSGTKFIKHKIIFKLSSIIVLLLGLFLCYTGFFG